MYNREMTDPSLVQTSIRDMLSKKEEGGGSRSGSSGGRAGGVSKGNKKNIVVELYDTSDPDLTQIDQVSSRSRLDLRYRAIALDYEN